VLTHAIIKGRARYYHRNMARIVGVDIPNEKRVEVAMTYIHGIGLKTSQKILADTNVDQNKRAKDLTKEEINRVYEFIEKNVMVE